MVRKGRLIELLVIEALNEVGLVMCDVKCRTLDKLYSGVVGID